ncbi:3-hydroxyacyl-CoA dehydrogenase family protein [Actinophytocola sp.]|uniref:3-hydroxyacyl-CoA dehydrogenase family protein n=1 Tax=Actinophytocola sp. TaxID=1872138 RepID=UPI00389A0220
MGPVGVVGAGVMGTGVAQCLAEHGHDVILVDVGEDVLARARQRIEQDIRMARMLRRDLLRDGESIMAAITCAAELDPLREADYVIENITEDWSAKNELYRRLDEVLAEECVIAANTSAIPITRIAGATTRPDRVVGIHFMNPVPMKNTVELIAGYHTSAATVERTEELLSAMGKRAVRVGDSPGFVSNRVLMLTINEAAFLVHENVADAAAVDEVFVSCFGHPMGPLATADLIGVDTILRSIEVLHDSFADSKYRPCPLLRQMVDAGLHGKKSGQGFFSYGPGAR